MCDRNVVLVIFILFKVIVLIVAPIMLIFFYKKDSRMYTPVGIATIFFIVFLILLRFLGNNCIINSNISYISSNHSGDKSIKESEEIGYSEVYSISKYLNRKNQDIFNYNINKYPLKNVKISCDKKSYMKNYGDSITAITMLISNAFGYEFNEIDILNFLDKKGLVSCEKGIDFDKAFNALSEKYFFDIIKINSSEIDNYLQNGNSILMETLNKYEEPGNFGCGKDYLIIYNISTDDKYNLINPNDKDYSYFCPSNTIGYGSIIDGNQNDKTYSFDEIDNKASRFFVIEVK